MARFTPSFTPTDDTNWEAGNPVRQTIFATEVGGNLEYLLQEHAHRDGVDGDGGAIAGIQGFFIAASDASEAEQAHANVVCDGVADEVEINAYTAEGPITLSSGHFYTADNILLYDNGSISGQGDHTVLVSTAEYVFENADTTDGNSGLTVANLKIEPSNGFGIGFRNCTNVRIVGVHVDGLGDTDAGGIICVEDVGKESREIRISGCMLENIPDNPALYLDDADYSTVIGNTFVDCYSGIVLSGGVGIVVQGNTVINVGNDGIRVQSGCSHCTVIGNVIVGTRVYIQDSTGLLCTESDDCTLVGNVISGMESYAIGLYYNNRVIVASNTIYQCGQLTDNAHDAIYLQESVVDCVIMGNAIHHGGGATRHRYGINVAHASCTGNEILFNDLREAGRTAGYNNVGLNTNYLDPRAIKNGVVNNPQGWGYQAGREFWALWGNAGALVAGNAHELIDYGWTATNLSFGGTSTGDFGSAADDDPPYLAFDASGDLLQSPLVFGNYSHFRQAQEFVGALPTQLVLEVYASFPTTTANETTTGFGWCSGTPATAGNGEAFVHCTATTFALRDNVTVDAGAAKDNAWHLFKIVLTVGGSAEWFIDGVSQGTITLPADCFPVAFAAHSFTTNRLRLAWVRAFYQ